jgi:hypothetical protein
MKKQCSKNLFCDVQSSNRTLVTVKLLLKLYSVSLSLARKCHDVMLK